MMHATDNLVNSDAAVPYKSAAYCKNNVELQAGPDSCWQDAVHALLDKAAALVELSVPSPHLMRCSSSLSL
jgi:hypothetical protein